MAAVAARQADRRDRGPQVQPPLTLSHPVVLEIRLARPAAVGDMPCSRLAGVQAVAAFPQPMSLRLAGRYSAISPARLLAERRELRTPARRQFGPALVSPSAALVAVHSSAALAGMVALDRSGPVVQEAVPHRRLAGLVAQAAAAMSRCVSGDTLEFGVVAPLADPPFRRRG